MDPINNRDTVFSRGPSPPPQPQPFQVPPSQLSDPHVSPAPSLRETAPLSAPSHLESLFYNISVPSASHASPQPSTSGSLYPGPAEQTNSGHATPASVNAGSVASSLSGQNNAAFERQNALLSLLGAVSGPQNAQTAPSGVPFPPQQMPTPPGSASAQRAHISRGESQGKALLEQLMSGSAPKYTSDSQHSSLPAGPSPSYHVPPVEAHDDDDEYYSVEGHYSQQEVTRDVPEVQGASVSQQRPPSPAPAKRKPPPTQQPISSGHMDDPSWQPMSMDPKRKSVENLIDQLTRGQVPPPAPMAAASFDQYNPNEEPIPQAEPLLSKASRPLPPQPAHGTSSPRASPPKPPAQQRQQRRTGESPVGPSPVQQGPFGPSPSSYPAQGVKTNQEGRRASKGKALSPNSQSQNIVFDVSQSLDEIQAPREAVKSTAIALVKVESTFLPGTTIGATHWVAYAMTKGRVRVISRSSGDRTLLQLPSIFGPSVTVSDMSVHGNRLAGITSDGGFVVWELPEVITDDVPGKIMLCVHPSSDPEPLHAVKFHPHRSDLVAVASDTNIYLVNVDDTFHVFGGERISQNDLHRAGQIFSVPSPIVAFDFDVPRNALATISEDSTLTMWNIRDKLPFWSHRVRGDDTPSSLTFVEGGVVVGRRNGTFFQLLPIMGRNILSTLKFVNASHEDPDMFGHVNYDSRIQTLWVANNRRDSLIACKINFDNAGPSPGGEDGSRGAYFEQVIEFGGPRPTIHFVILTPDADPTGEEAHAACVAAKVPPGELALVAFSVHASGVDQVLIRKEWFTSALANTPSRFPGYVGTVPELPPIQPKPQRQHPMPTVAPISTSQPPPPITNVAPPRPKTPPSEELEGEGARDDGARSQEGKGRTGKGKNVGWKDKDEIGKEKDAKSRGGDATVINDSPLGVALSKEIRKVEENLHTRIGRLIGKELDKQHQRLEDARANEQAADFVRQEKILKLISTELTKNTTRVVEMAVKSEVQSSVLPSLENITKTEVKAALSNQIAKGVTESMKQSLPTEIERMLLRPDMTNHIARTFSSSVTPIIKDTITKNFVPAATQQISAMHQELSREIHTEVHTMKKELMNWHTEALRGQETSIRELESLVRMLSDQVKYMSMNLTPHGMPNRNSPVPSTSAQHTQATLNNLLRANLPMNQPPSGFQHTQQPHQAFPPPLQQSAPPQMQGGWFNSNIAAPQASHPTAPPPLPSQQQQQQQQQQVLPRTPPLPTQPEEWDETYLAVLTHQDTRRLRDLLGRSNPEVIMPIGGHSPLSQAVILTLVHRLSTIASETSPLDDLFKIATWWLQRAATVLNTADPLISPYVGRVLPPVMSTLNTAKQRLAILPGPPVEAVRTIAEIQDILNRKPA